MGGRQVSEPTRLDYIPALAQVLGMTEDDVRAKLEAAQRRIATESESD